MEIDIFEISNVPNFNKFRILLLLGANLGLIGGKYLIEITFDVKIEIDITETSDVPNFNKF